MTYLVTGTNKPYWPKIKPYLESLSKYSKFDNICITVGFIPDDVISNVRYLEVPESCLTDITTNPCVQAGEFLSHVNLDDSSVIIFTDGDIRLQREFTTEEEKLFTSLEDGEFLAGPNATHNLNTITNEANGLRRYCSDSYLQTIYDYAGITGNEPTLNMGVLSCTVSTYKDLRNKTYEIFRKFPEVTNHMARQQWYMNIAAYSLCSVRLLPFTVHSHSHNGDQPGMKFDIDGTMYVNNKDKVLFRHKYYV